MSVLLCVAPFVKEKSNLLSIGLNVRDSAAPENFLNVPEPLKALALVSYESPVIL